MGEINSKLYIFEEEWNELEMALREHIQTPGQRTEKIKD